MWPDYSPSEFSARFRYSVIDDDIEIMSGHTLFYSFEVSTAMITRHVSSGVASILWKGMSY